MEPKKQIVPNKAKDIQEQRDLAMPHVKQLVKKYSRQTVNWCVQQLAEYERRVKKVEMAKKDLARMEAELD